MSSCVFITGTSSGIGRELAVRYLELGWNVFGVSRRDCEDLQRSKNFTFRRLDVSNPQTVPVVLESLFDKTPALELVILNAGILGEIRDMQETKLSELRKLMDVNVWANKTIMDFLLHRFNKVRQIVSISSGAAVNGNRGWGGYSISKAALNMLTMLYASENPDTHFTSLAPGLVDTAMQEYLCNLPNDRRFTAIDVLKSKRYSAEMPNPEVAAKNLVDVIATLPQQIESGHFIDVRQLRSIDDGTGIFPNRD